MNRTLTITIASLLALSCAEGCKPAAAVAAKAPPSANSPNQPPAKPVDLLGDLPAKAQETIKAQVGDGEILSVNDATEDDDVSYEIEMKKGGQNRVFSVADDGTLLSYQVFESELPASVLNIFRAEFSGARFGDIFRENDDGELSFSIDAIGSDKTNSLSVAEDGSWWMRELSLAEVPEPVRQSLRRAWAALEPDDVSKNFADGELTYEFSVQKDDRDHSLVLTPDGKLVEREDEMAIESVPAPVQATIRKSFAASEILSISQVTEPDGVTFEVTGQKGNEELNITIGPKGRILSQSKGNE